MRAPSRKEAMFTVLNFGKPVEDEIFSRLLEGEVDCTAPNDSTRRSIVDLLAGVSNSVAVILPDSCVEAAEILSAIVGVTGYLPILIYADAQGYHLSYLQNQLLSSRRMAKEKL